MISLTIGDMNKMTRQDADALRAIANVYHPINRNDNMDVGTLREAIGRGQPGALSTLAELNDAVRTTVPTSLVSAAASIVADYGKGPNTDAKIAEAIISGTITASNTGTLIDGGRDIGAAARGTINVPRAQELGAAFLASVSGTAARTGAVATERIAPEDNPATGAPDQHALADQVFSGGVASLTSGNVESVKEYTTALESFSAAADDAAAKQVFSGGGLSPEVQGAALAMAAGQAESRALEQPAPNVHAAIPTPPPLPVVTPPTSPQQSTVAPSVSPPPPPPPAPAPVDASAAALTTNPAPSVELDSAGLPWDSRIHASTKAKIANGTWKKRRGVDEAEVTQVEAQLRATMAVPPAPASANPWPFPTDSSSVTGQQAEAPPTFPVLMAFITARVGDKRLTQEQVTAAVQSAGLESLNLVMARPDLIPQIMAALREVAP